MVISGKSEVADKIYLCFFTPSEFAKTLVELSGCFVIYSNS